MKSEKCEYSNGVLVLYKFYTKATIHHNRGSAIQVPFNWISVILFAL